MMENWYPMDEYRHYILVDRVPVKEPNFLIWGAWMIHAPLLVRRSVGKATIGKKSVENVEVSTVFLGVDHGVHEDQPLLFETMVFGGPLDQECERCATWEAAEKMHEKMCLHAKIAVKET